MPVCPKCNAVYEDDLKFCKVDGTPLVPMTSEAYLPLGAVVNESLRVIDRVRTDRFGVVYRVEDAIVTARPLALRLFRRGLVSSKVFEALGALAERMRTDLDEPDILAGYIPIQLEDGRYALLADDSHGSTLDALLAREAPLTPTFVVMALVRIADVLSGAHERGLFHGNLTPENVIVLDRTERTLAVKLADFGVASTMRKHNARGLTAPTDFSLLRNYDNYYAPEIVTGRGVKADARTDVFAIGALCYQMLSGWIPFSEAALEGETAVYMTEDPRPLNVLNKELGVPNQLERIMLKALERDPAARHQSMSELVDALQEVEFELSINPIVPGPGRRQSRTPRRAARTPRGATTGPGAGNGRGRATADLVPPGPPSPDDAPPTGDPDAPVEN